MSLPFVLSGYWVSPQSCALWCKRAKPSPILFGKEETSREPCDLFLRPVGLGG